MIDRRFPICSTPTPPCIGRNALLDRLQASLTKQTPDHVQVVGPRFSGKTVLLTQLIKRLEEQRQPYTAIVLWDLSHQTLESDSHFIWALCAQLALALRVNHPDYADHLASEPNPTVGLVSEVLEALSGDGAKVLLVLDRFDSAVVNGCLTRNVWDQLRELASKPSLRLVTSSRKRLAELIRDPDTATSPFWNIFEQTPFLVGCFDETDIGAVLARAPELQLSKGARSELLNTSNAFPLLALEVLNGLLDIGESGEISAEAMLKGANAAYSVVRDRLRLQWSDCSPTAQDLFRQVHEEGEVQRSKAASVDADSLVERGFVHTAGNKLQRACRLLVNLLDETQDEGSSLARLFSSSDAYQVNLRAVFEHRITQIDQLDTTLARHLKHGISDLPDHPGVFLSHIRAIVDRALDLIWDAETPNRRIPSEWMSIWKHNEEPRVEILATKFPQGVTRLHLLNLMTGTDRSDPCARLITKEIYVLVNAVHAFGNFGQHQEGTPVSAETGYSALHLCIELTAAVTRLH